MNERNRPLIILLLVLIVLALVGPLSWGGMMGPGMMGPGMMWGIPASTGSTTVSGWSWGLMMVVGGLSMLAFWGALIVGVVLLVRWIAGATTSPSRQTEHSALDILQRRYAAGEISQEQYHQMRETLER